MKHTRKLVAVSLALVLVAGACGGSDEDGDDGADSTVSTDADSTVSTDADSTVSTDADDASTADRDASLVFGYVGMPNSMDNLETRSDFWYLFTDPVYDTLIRRTADNEYVPGIADSWESTDTEMTFTIAEGRTFQDGTPLDAAAVEANINRLLTFESRYVRQVEAIDSVSTDGNVVTLQLNQPAASLVGVFADLGGQMMSPAGFDADDRSTYPIGSGPFIVTDLSEGAVKYERWDDYYDADNINYKYLEIRNLPDDNTRLAALSSGEIDVATLQPAQVVEAEASGVEVQSRGQTNNYGIAINVDGEGLDNPLVRQAISHAIDREGVNQALFDGGCTPTVQGYPEGSLGHWPGGTVEAYGSYDPDLSRQLLAEAGYADGLTLDFITVAVPTYANQIEVYQAQLAEVGITAQPQILEVAQYGAALIDTDYDLMLGPVATARPDEVAHWKEYFTPETSRNSSYELPGINEMIAELEGSTDPEVRGEILQRLVEAMLEDGPREVFICSPEAVYGAVAAVDGLEVPLALNVSLRGLSKAE